MILRLDGDLVHDSLVVLSSLREGEVARNEAARNSISDRISSNVSGAHAFFSWVEF